MENKDSKSKKGTDYKNSGDKAIDKFGSSDISSDTAIMKGVKS